jgi:mannosyltransferase
MGARAEVTFARPIPDATLAGRYAEGLLGAAALISAALFVFAGMNRPVWLDEANSVLISSRTFAGIIQALSLENNLPGYYFLLAVWMRLFGDSEIALRTLSGLFYLAGCGGAFALGRRLVGDVRAGWYSALFYECSAIAIRQAQNIRMYTLLGMLAAYSTLAFLRIFRDGDRSRRAWALFFGINAAGLLTHVWFGFALFAQGIAILIFARRQAVRFGSACAASALPFLLLWGPRFLAQFRNGATDWMNWFQWRFLVLTPLELYNPPAGTVLYILAIGTVATAGARRCRQQLPGNGVWVLLTVAVASLAVPLAISAVRPVYAPGRYTMIALAPLAAVLGAVLSRLLPRPLLAITGVLLLAVQLSGHMETLDNAPDGQPRPGESDRVTSAYLLSHAAPGDAVVFTSLTRAASDYYFRRAGAAERFVELSFPASTATHLGWSNPKVSPSYRPVLESEASVLAETLRKLAAGGARVWTYDGYAPQQTEILREELSKQLLLEQIIPLAGPYHTRLLLWRSMNR